MATKKSFAKRVKGFLNQGDSAKLGKFEKTINRTANNEIADLKTKIETDEEKLEEALENQKDHFLDVDMHSIEDIDKREGYARSYLADLVDYEERNIAPIKERIENNKEKIEKLRQALTFFHTVEASVEESDDKE